MPEGNSPTVVLIVPCYNESTRFLERDFTQALREMPNLGLLFVDDGSHDQTKAVLSQFVEKFPERAYLHSLPENQGKAEAVRLGIKRLWAAEGDLPWTQAAVKYFGYWDADLATPFRELPRFLDVFATRPALKMVMGARVNLLGRNVRRKAIRHYLGRMFATAASLVLNLAVYDTQCGAKVFRSQPELDVLFEGPFVTGWIFDVELLARVLRILKDQCPRSAIYELPLLEWEDVAGSKIKGRDFFKASWSLVRIARLYPRPVLSMKKAR